MFRRFFIGLGVVSTLTWQAVAAAPFSADGVWEGVAAVPAERQKLKPWVRPARGRTVRLHRPGLTKVLARVAPEGGQPTELSVPMPDGAFARFAITEVTVMAPELAANYPEIKTYAGRGLDDPAASIRLDWTPAGFHAQVLSPRGAVYVDPYSQGDTEYYASYSKRDYRKEADDWICLSRAEPAAPAAALASATVAQRSGATLRTYRLACAATGEYTAYHGGTVAGGLAAIVTAVNRVSGVYELELAIRLVLVANNDLLVYTNSGTDPYTNNNGSTMLGQNQSTIDSVIGSANYDIGHVFSTGGGGVAYLGCVCNNKTKAGGVTGLTAPTGDAFYIDYVAHEMGHQFGANHTFNSETSSCGSGNRNASTAYEVGSGSTIMAYAGICGADNLQPHSDPYFHFASFDEIQSYIAGGGNCAVSTATSNAAPTVSAGAGHVIPANTPFKLTATGADPDGHPLTYCWEERDLGAAQTLSAADNGTSPLFRSFDPTNSPSRIFPKLAALLSNTNSLGEQLPNTTRTLNFRVTARDNQPAGGGVNTDDMQLSVSSSAGPFLVTWPNSSVTVSGAVTVTWNVAGTDLAPINAAAVNIRLSTDGGLSFPVLLSSNTPNDGVQLVVLPNLASTQARVLVEATDNVFFDLSNTNFTIVPGAPFPLVERAGTQLLAESCLPANGAVDPAETVTVNFGLQNLGNANTSNLVATLLPVGGVSIVGGPQVYGVLTAGAAAVSRPFSLVATGGCGATVTAVLQLQDGPTSYGLVSNTLVLGSVSSLLNSLTNTASLSIPNSGKASLYPSSITVSNLANPVSKVVVRLVGLTHAYPDDLDILLAGPGGQKVMLLSDAGGANAVSGLTLTFDDAATGTAPDSTALATGSYRPTDYAVGETMAAPAPAGPYATALSAFNGQAANGTWSLYIQDDQSPDKGSLSGGWELILTTAQPSCCQGGTPNRPPVILAASVGPLAPSTTNDLVAVVTSAEDPEGDPISFAYQWQQAGLDIAQTNAVLPAAATVAGQSYRCVITPHDGQTSGTNFVTTAVLVATDADLDEMNDDWELVNFGSLAAAPGADADGDGLTNAQEYRAGTDPNAAGDSLRITRIEPGVTIRFTSVLGKSYTVQYRDDLLAGNWQPLTNNVAGTGTELGVTDPGAAEQPQRFYRVRLEP